MVFVTISLERLEIFDILCSQMRDTNMAIAIFWSELRDMRYTTAQQYALMTSHVTRMILQED